jgi:uncharacterized membrane protein YuzA (DUF378 family)
MTLAQMLAVVIGITTFVGGLAGVLTTYMFFRCAARRQQQQQIEHTGTAAMTLL